MSIVISGMGAHCALGSSTKELLEGINGGRCAIGPITRFDVSSFETKLGGMVPGGDLYESDEQRLLSYALQAAKEALKNAGITDYSKVSLVLGTSNGMKRKKIYDISYDLAGELNLGGLVITVSTACTSSSHAIGFAAGLLRKGTAGVVLAGGVDTLTRDVFAGFYSLGLLSKTPCSPFSNSLGTTLGEGAAFLLMETEENALQRGIHPQAVFMGYGISADAFHDTKPDQGGSGVCTAIIHALKDSKLEPGDIGYINAHGTGTAANDSAEWRGIQGALSGHAFEVPVSSSKSFYGHAQGAAGALEVVTTLISMQQNVIPPTLNYNRPRPFTPNDPVASLLPRPHPVRYALSTNSGFGGVNSALIFGKQETTRQPLNTRARPVSVVEYATVTDRESINRYIPYDDLRSTDLSAQLLAGVVAEILDRAGITIRSNECEPIGLFVGQDHLCEESIDDLDNSIKERGINHLSAAAFTRLVINYPAGVCCRLFGLKGPLAAIAAKPGNGLTALCLAADYLSRRTDTDYLVVAFVDEQGQANGTFSGAAGLLLKAGDETAPLRLRGWSMSRNHHQATEEALAMSGLKTGEVPAPFVASSPDRPDLCALIDAIGAGRTAGHRFIHLQSERNNPYMGIDIIMERKE